MSNNQLPTANFQVPFGLAARYLEVGSWSLDIPSSSLFLPRYDFGYIEGVFGYVAVVGKHVGKDQAGEGGAGFCGQRHIGV